jgi:two-component sensor histidine kinase
MDAFAAAFEGRIRALAKAHDLLAASNWQGADLREVLLAEVAVHRERDHLSLDGEAVSLAPNAALMLGMVFHELATNAAKYGAFTTAAGRVAVAWKSDDRGDLLKITWAERGVPKVERPRQDGFGLALIERGIAHELQGRATFDFGGNGLRCSLEIPLAEVRPPLLPSAGTRDQ